MPEHPAFRVADLLSIPPLGVFVCRVCITVCGANSDMRLVTSLHDKSVTSHVENVGILAIFGDRLMGQSSLGFETVTLWVL